MQTVVTCKTHVRYATIEINRPEALNALNKSVLLELKKCLEDLNNNKDISVVIVKSAGEKAFVAGADIKEMQNLSPLEAQHFSKLGIDIFQSLSDLPQITIAQVQGFALGGGLELALACDFMICSEKARFGLPEVSLGLIPGFAGTQRLARRIGIAKAIEWVTTGEKYTADEARSCGLVNHVVKADDLNDFTLAMANKILKNGPQAVLRAKMVIKEGLQTSLSSGSALENQAFGLCFGHAESKEGMTAFIEKRPAKFEV